MLYLSLAFPRIPCDGLELPSVEPPGLLGLVSCVYIGAAMAAACIQCAMSKSASGLCCNLPGEHGLLEAGDVRKLPADCDLPGEHGFLEAGDVRKLPADCGLLRAGGVCTVPAEDGLLAFGDACGVPSSFHLLEDCHVWKLPADRGLRRRREGLNLTCSRPLPATCSVSISL